MSISSFAATGAGPLTMSAAPGSWLPLAPPQPVVQPLIPQVLSAQQLMPQSLIPSTTPAAQTAAGQAQDAKHRRHRHILMAIAGTIALGAAATLLYVLTRGRMKAGRAQPEQQLVIRRRITPSRSTAIDRNDADIAPPDRSAGQARRHRPPDHDSDFDDQGGSDEGDTD